MVNKEYLEKILPHKGPMVLIDDVTSYSLEKGWLKSVVEIREDSIFYDKTLGGVSSVVGIEFMAQTIAAFAFLYSGKEEPQIGFLLGTRLYNNKYSVFKLGETLEILVKQIFFSEDIVSFECFIYNENKEEISSATINVYQNDNIEERLNNG